MSNRSTPTAPALADGIIARTPMRFTEDGDLIDVKATIVGTFRGTERVLVRRISVFDEMFRDAVSNQQQKHPLAYVRVRVDGDSRIDG